MAYLDAGTTQRLNQAGRAALLDALDQGWADPARLHREGRRAAVMIDAAKATIADLLGVRVDEIHLTRSGTDAAHRAIGGLARGRQRVAGPLVRTAIEHSSVIHAVEAAAERAGASVHVVPVDRDGLLDLDDLERALAAGAPLTAVQSVNQETGTLQPLDAVAEISHRQHVPLVVDAAQSVGREPLPQHWDVLTASAHKWAGPAGVGLLAVRTGVRWRPAPAASGASTREPAWTGFPDVPAVVAAAAALEQSERERDTARPRLMAFTEQLRRAAAAIPDVEVVGHPTQRAAHLLTFSCLYVAGEAIVDALDREGFSVASGSACSADALGPSHVLAAMGVLTHGNVRIGLPADVESADVERLAALLPTTIETIRREAGVDRL